MSAEVHSDSIEVSNLYGARTQRGLVQIRWGGQQAQLTVHEATRHALCILEAATNAELDEQLVAELKRRGCSQQECGAVIGKLRELNNHADGYWSETMPVDTNQLAAVALCKRSLLDRSEPRLAAAVDEILPGRGAEVLAAVVSLREAARL